MWLYNSVMSPNNADRMANSVDPDQTAPAGAVWSGSALFAQAYLSENLGSLRIQNFSLFFKQYFEFQELQDDYRRFMDYTDGMFHSDYLMQLRHLGQKLAEKEISKVTYDDLEKHAKSFSLT